MLIILFKPSKVVDTIEVPGVSVKKLTDYSIQIGVRPWANNRDFDLVRSDVLENCKLVFDAAGISIHPFVKEVATHP